MSQTKTQLVEGLNINTSAPATALQIDASGNINLDSNTLYVDATNNRVGLGESAPESILHLKGSNATLKIESSVNTGYSGLEFDRAADDTHFAIYAYDSSHATQANNVQFYGYQNGRLDFHTNSSASPRLSIASGGNVGIGATTVDEKLHVEGSSGQNTTIKVESTATSAERSAVEFFNGSISRGRVSGSNDFDGLTLDSSTTESSAVIRFRTGGGSLTEKARIDSSGRLLVGTSSTLAGATDSLLQIRGNSSGTQYAGKVALATEVAAGSIVSGTDLGAIYFGNVANGIGGLIECKGDAQWGTNDYPGRLVFCTTADGASSPTERFRISSAGYLRAVGSSSTARIIPDVDNVGYLGQSSERWQAVYAVNGTIQTSDRRQKTDIAEALLGSDFIKTLKPVSYKWIEGGKEPTGEIDENGDRVFTSIPGQRTHWGFIAQDVKEAVDAAGVDFGGWLLDDKDDPDSQQALRYDQFIAPLTKALQEAMQRIETLEAKVAALEAA